MAYTFDQIFAADPSNTSTVAANASVLIFAPGDSTKTALALTKTDGSALPNPVTVNANGFGPAFIHATLDRVAWEGGGYSGFFTSYDGMKAEAVAARQAADAAKADATNAAANAASSATSAANSANLVNAPADSAVQTLVNAENSLTRGALNGKYARSSGRIYLDNYLLSGVSHTTALKNAIGASAGKVLVLGGTALTIEDIIEITGDDITIDARGSSIALTDDGTATGRIVRFTNCARASWIGGKISQTAATRSGVYGLLTAVNCTDLLIDSPVIIGGSSTAFYGETLNGFTLRNIRARDSKADGIHIARGSKNGSIASPHIIGAGDDGVAIVSHTTHAQCENISVTDPVVRNLVTLGAGVAFVGPKNCSLTGGIIDDPISSGVKVTNDAVAGTHLPSDITITGTRVRAVTDGFVVGNATDVTLSNVSSAGGSGVGFLLSTATRAHIVGGKVRGHTDVGVYSTGGAANNLIGVDLRGNTGGATAGTAHTLTNCLTA